MVIATTILRFGMSVSLMRLNDSLIHDRRIIGISRSNAAKQGQLCRNQINDYVCFKFERQ